MTRHQFYEDFFARFGQERSEIRTGTASPILSGRFPTLETNAQALLPCNKVLKKVENVGWATRPPRPP